MTTIHPELRCALVAAARRVHQPAVAETASAAAPSSRRWAPRSLRPLILGGSASGVAAAVAAAVLLLASAGGAPTAAQAFPILARPASALSAHPALARQLRAGADDVVPSVQEVHAFTGPGVTGGVSQATVGSMSIICLGFATTDGSSGRAGCSATANAEQQGIVLSDGGVFVALVPAGGSVAVTTAATTTAVAVDAGGIATGAVTAPSTLTVTVAGQATTTQLPSSGS